MLISHTKMSSVSTGKGPVHGFYSMKASQISTVICEYNLEGKAVKAIG